MFQMKIVEKIKTQVLSSIFFCLKIVSFRDKVEKYCRAGQTTDNNTAPRILHWPPKRYSQTFRIYSTFCFSTLKMVARRSLNDTFTYIACLGFSIYILSFWRRIFFFQILAHPVFKMWVIQKPNKVALWNKRLLKRKNGDYTACLKYSVWTFVE